jgi:hypothetical protein
LALCFSFSLAFPVNSICSKLFHISFKLCMSTSTVLRADHGNLQHKSGHVIS